MRRAQAFTLVEILASVLLFVMGGMAIIGVIIYGMGSAAKAQADATAWSTALSVLKDPLPLGAVSERTTGRMVPWTWSRSGDTWTADDGSAQTVWQYTAWPIDRSTDLLISDMHVADTLPLANNPALFPPGGSPAAGCARGWLNGYYVERREQSRAADRISDKLRLVEVRVDVYWAAYGASDGRPLASVVDRVVREGQ
jgi:Tfp pilus assembly protein PilV